MELIYYVDRSCFQFLTLQVARKSVENFDKLKWEVRSGTIGSLSCEFTPRSPCEMNPRHRLIPTTKYNFQSPNLLQHSTVERVDFRGYLSRSGMLHPRIQHPLIYHYSGWSPTPIVRSFRPPLVPFPILSIRVFLRCFLLHMITQTSLVSSPGLVSKARLTNLLQSGSHW